VTIRARGVGFRYEGRAAWALRDLDLEVEAGECLLVLGPSGSGKSTLARALAGLVPRDVAGEWEGELQVAGLDTRSASPQALAARVGIVFQEPASQIVMERVEDEIAFGLENRGWPLAEMRARVPVSLGEAGLTGTERRRCTTLSGGQQQRLALASVLAPRPGVLVLDEPTANLDPAGAAAFLERLGVLVRGRATTVVLVEHRVEAAWKLADRVLALDATGRPIASGRPDEVLGRHGAALRGAGIWLPGDSVAPAPPAWEGLAHRPLVVARGLGFAYGDGPTVLSAVDVAVSPGERVALLGLNGSGKSTLAKLLVGLLRPTAGEVRLGGERPDRMPPSRLADQAAYVFQDPELQFLADSVRDEIALGLPAGDRPGAEALVESLGLPLGRLGSVSPYTLSGGEKRRLSVALALLRHPALLVLDEPTFGQDRHGFEALCELVRERVAEGTAVVAASHDLQFVAAVAQRAVVLEAGALVHDGAAAALLADHVALVEHGLAA
jgi:energy-coupling factor transporter ATP-binding protein EcfA2